MTKDSCSTCVYWKGDPEDARRLWENWEEDTILPHSNFRWGVCRAAPMGFDNEHMEEHPEAKMAVYDGSGYYAELVTRLDHVCGEHKKP